MKLFVFDHMSAGSADGSADGSAAGSAAGSADGLLVAESSAAGGFAGT